MKSILLFLASLAFSSTAFAQGAAPFWEALSGPPGPELGVIQVEDSTAGNNVGGTIYVIDTATHRWVPRQGEQPQPKQSSGWRVLAVRARYWLLNDLASHNDSLYSWDDTGKLWRYVGRFGSGGENSIQYVFRTESKTLLVDDSDVLYVSQDTLRTFESIRLPQPFAMIYTDADTLFLASVYGNLFRSENLGKTWLKVFDSHDTSSNWRIGLSKSRDIFIAAEWQQELVFPFRDTSISLAVSLDRGRSWSEASLPVPKYVPSILGVDSEHRIFAWVDVYLGENYRSDDLGKTWHKLSQASPGLYVDRDGTVYFNNLYSRDHGETWDTISNDGVACLPRSMLAFHDSTVISTLEFSTNARLFGSSDFGESWQRVVSGVTPPAVLSLRPDSTDWIMCNTTRRLYPSGGSRTLCWYHYEPREGIGCITSGLHAWLTGLSYYVVGHVGADGSRHDSVLAKYYMLESTDTGCSYYSFSYDTLSPTPITQAMESGHDTILAVSRSGIYRGFDILTPFDTVTPEQGTGAMPTGAMMKDSTGAIYVAMSDGKIFVTSDDAMTWRSFATPTDARAPITSLASVPNGKVLAVDSNLETGFTRTWLYDPEKTLWIDVTYGLKRAGFSNTAIVTNVWYVNDYAYAGTWNMGLFRSHRPVTGIESVETESHSSPYKLYPNPAGSTVTFTYPAAQDNYEYRLMDITGNEIARGPIPRNSTSTVIDLRSIASGHYTITCDGWGSVKLAVRH